MKIINYNKTKHDIYTFDESGMTLCVLPTSATESIPGVRRHATITGWNTVGLWNNNIDGSGVPDWSGLSARSRGSNLYATPTYNLRTSLWDEFDGGSSDPKFSDITNWNNGIPVYIIISKKHFIACAHFIGLSNFTPQSFDILDKDGVIHSITGQYVSTEGDTKLYRITSITGGSLPPATEINPTHKIKIYQILNSVSTINNWEGLRIWHQVNNGMFVTTTRFNNMITYADACENRSTTPTILSGLPILSESSTIWKGDSGSPILATYNGETYLIGMSNGGHSDYSHPSVLPWLRSNLLSDGITITLFDPLPTSITGDMGQYFFILEFSGGVQDQRVWNEWGNDTIAFYQGERIETNTNPPNSNALLPRAYPFEKNPTNPQISSPWHNILYELTYPLYEWGARSFFFNFPFGGFRPGSNAGFPDVPMPGLEGVIGSYILLKEKYVNEDINNGKCPARWKGMKEAFNAILKGTMIPTNASRPSMTQPSNICLYLPGFMGWGTYREESCKYWDDLPGSSAEKDIAWKVLLDNYIADIIYIKNNGASNGGSLYISIDTAAVSASPSTVEVYRTILPGQPTSTLGYKATSSYYYGASGHYRSDVLELSDWYVKTKLEEAGIQVFPEARPLRIVNNIEIDSSSGGYKSAYTGNNTGNLIVPQWTNYIAIEYYLNYSATFVGFAPDSDFDTVFRYPASGMELILPYENSYGQPDRIVYTSGGVPYNLSLFNYAGPDLVSSPFFYIHHLYALVDHIKYNDRINSGSSDFSDIIVKHKNLTVVQPIFTNTKCPIANNSTSDITRYYIHPSRKSIEPRFPFLPQVFTSNPSQYSGGFWLQENKDYWDNNIRTNSWDEFILKLRTISTQVAPKGTPASGSVVNYPNDDYTQNILKSLILPAGTVPTPTFSCNTNTGDCISDPNGTWVNKSDCDAVCNVPPPPLKYTCNPDGVCVQSDIGVSLLECIASCVAAPTQQNSESLNYDVWAAAFSGRQWTENPNHPWMTGDYRFHSVVPMAQMESVTNNGRRTAPTTSSAFAYNQLKDRLNTIPKGRRVILNWYNMNDVSPFVKQENDYYKNTSDGFLYKGEKFLSVWQDKGSEDAKVELTRIFGLLDSDQIDFDYIYDDHESEGVLYGMQGQNAFPGLDAAGNAISIFGSFGVIPDARVFGAIISDPRFTQNINPYTNRSFSDDFLDFYKQLSKQPNTTLTTNQILEPWLNINTSTDFHTPATFDINTINPKTNRPYSDEVNFIVPAWQGSYYLHLKYGYWAKIFNEALLRFPRYADVIISNYETCPISIEEAEYSRDSNNGRQFIPPLTNTTIGSGGAAFYGIPKNIIYAYWAEAAGDGSWNANSGYVRNPSTDMDRYSWAYYLINPSLIPSTVDFKKYAETTASPSFMSERSHKQLIDDVKTMRHILRSSPLWWQQNVPNIRDPQMSYYGGPNNPFNDWHELVYHTILHGLLYIEFFTESYIEYGVEFLHNALVEWKRISNNSGAEPCSRVDGKVSSNATPVDRVLLHDAVENILISGGKLLKSGKYIWRLTAPPSMRVGKYIHFRRLQSETDLTLPETIIVDCSIRINGRGAWIVRDVQGMPKYESYIPTILPPKYSCNTITKNCDADVNGSWDDKQECADFCSNITPINRVDCINSVCRETNPDGRYVNIEECLSGAACSPVVPPTTTYDCINKQCVAITTGSPGPFISIDACITNCIDTSPSSWDCINNKCIEFIDDPFHQYSTLERCSQNCTVIPPTVTYDCIDGTCRPVYGDPSGRYPDLLSCTRDCRVLEINTWGCVNNVCREITGTSGVYKTELECLGSICRDTEIPVTTWNCVSGVCVSINQSTGVYRTQQDCINRGCGIIIPPTPPKVVNKILENPQFIDVTKSIPTTPLSGYPYNSR